MQVAEQETTGPSNLTTQDDTASPSQSDASKSYDKSGTEDGRKIFKNSNKNPPRQTSPQER